MWPNRSFLRIWSQLLKKSLMENFIFVQFYIVGRYLPSQKDKIPISLEYFLTFSAFMELKIPKRLHTLRDYLLDCWTARSSVCVGKWDIFLFIWSKIPFQQHNILYQLYQKYKIKLTDDRRTFLGIQPYVYSFSLTWL